SRRRHTRFSRDWSSDVCSSDLPTVILAHTKKGYGLGKAGQGRMATHSQKKLDDTDLLEFRDRFKLPLTDEQATELAFYKPGPDKIGRASCRGSVDVSVVADCRE